MRLAEARQRTGYSTRSFAKATGSSTRTIWELEKGRRLPQPSTVRRFAEVLAVPAGDVEEFRKAIRREACRNAPPEVIVQVDQMEVDAVNATVIRIAAQRSLREVMQYLIRSGHPRDVEQIYRELCGEGTGQKGQAKGKPSSFGADVSIERTKPDAG
jgi:transcriptional regulator with XRE-family HTH domain